MISLFDLPGAGVDLGVDKRHVPLVNLRLLVEQLKDAVRSGETHDHGVDLLGDLSNLAAELFCHIEEGNHHGDGQRPEKERLGTPSAKKTPPASATTT